MDFWETSDSRGIPSVDLDKFTKDMTDRLALRLSRTNGVKLISLGYRNSEPKEIITPTIPTPAILIKFIRIRPQLWIREGETIVRKQNNRIVVELMFKAYAIVKAGQKSEGKESQDLSVALAIAINSEAKFGHPGVGPAQLQEIQPEGYVDFNDDDKIDCKDSYAVWSVDWFHESLIGEIYTEGYYDELQVNPSTIKEIYLSFDSQEGKIEIPTREYIDSQGIKRRIYRGVNPETGERFESNYTLIAES